MISYAAAANGAHIPAANAASYPARHGNLVRPLIDGIPAFGRISDAIENALHSIWLTVAFFVPDFRFPNGESLFEALDRAVQRGLDVRVIFWRPNAESYHFGSTFAGTAADREMLRLRGSRFRARWDRAHRTYCQHQKCWVIDAGYGSETTFVGGINLSALAMESPGHRNGGKRHDVYVEVSGPAATDICHNFVQRWNEASDRDEADGSWCNSPADVMRFPERLSAPQGPSLVQVQRMVSPGRYTDDHAAPDASPYPIRDGERSILEQYVSAIDAARSSIYIENQALPVPEIAARIEAAVNRGIDVVIVVPAEACRDSDAGFQTTPWRSLQNCDNLTVATLSGPRRTGGGAIYVHSKLMLVDDAWATIGSCNLHQWSLGGHTEINAAIWDADVVRMLRHQLLFEHLAEDVRSLDDRQALRRFRYLALANRKRVERGSSCWQGLAIAIAPSVGAQDE